MQLNVEELINNFALFDDWEDRYGYLIELGKKLPPMDNALKTEQSLVNGCTSNVWLVSRVDDEGIYHFIGDSDSHIVKGLVAILLCVYQGKTSDQIMQVDIKSIFDQLGLSEHLSPNRRNGFFSMVERVRGVGGGLPA